MKKQVFLDIDLDFFVLDSGLQNGTFDFRSAISRVGKRGGDVFTAVERLVWTLRV